jgi:hexosaminidase
MQLVLRFEGKMDGYMDGIKALAADYNYCVAEGGLCEGEIRIAVEQADGAGIFVSRSGDSAAIRFDKKIHFFRALGLFLEKSRTSDQFQVLEAAQFTMNGAMFDVSQGNAVINVASVKDFLKRMAMMGLNMLMLYAEDSYKVETQPYFGYMRGKYSQDDIRECDTFADMLGIEMIPCIQTLAHFIDVFRWAEYNDIKQDYECLMVGEEKAYQFVEDLIREASAPFKTKRIHIGMDEAWNLGLGGYLEKNGLRKKYDIMTEHLARVLEIVKKAGLEPMMWSDMFFRAVSPTGGYYDVDGQMTDEMIATVPSGMQLVYWDYYHDKVEDYERQLELHQRFGSSPIFAGGIWTWIGFAANWGKTFNTTNPALEACKKHGIKEVFVTIWGDNGTESNVFSNLLGLQLFAEHGYAAQLDMNKLKDRFEFCTGANFDDFMDIKYLDEVPGATKDNMETVNPSKFLMWQDILTGLFDKNIEGLALNAHYAMVADKFKAAMGRNGSYNFLFEFLYHVANVLALKSELGIKITDAYRAGDKDALASFAKNELADLYKRVRALRSCHKAQWFDINKALGWDVLDMRYGSLLIRIESAIEQLTDYVQGKTDHLEELDEPRLYYSSVPGLVPYANFYGKIACPSRISPEA